MCKKRKLALTFRLLPNLEQANAKRLWFSFNSLKGTVSRDEYFLMSASGFHNFQLTNERKGKSEYKFDVAFETFFRIRSVFKEVRKNCILIFSPHCKPDWVYIIPN
jgi:hypothetical protein